MVALALVGCDTDDSSPTIPSTTATVRFDYRAATALSPNLPASTQVCVSGVGRTHFHPSWRGFGRIEMQAVGADLWQIRFTDVPIGERLSLRVSDANVCTENSTGAATRNVSANDVLLVNIVPTPGTGTGTRAGVHRGRGRDRDAVVCQARSVKHPGQLDADHQPCPSASPSVGPRPLPPGDRAQHPRDGTGLHR